MNMLEQVKQVLEKDPYWSENNMRIICTIDNFNTPYYKLYICGFINYGIEFKHNGWEFGLPITFEGKFLENIRKEDVLKAFQKYDYFLDEKVEKEMRDKMVKFIEDKLVDDPEEENKLYSQFPDLTFDDIFEFVGKYLEKESRKPNSNVKYWFMFDTNRMRKYFLENYGKESFFEEEKNKEDKEDNKN